MIELTSTQQPPHPKLLLLDPDAGFRKSLVGSLEHKGHDVDDVGEGGQALELLGRTAYDLMIVEIGSDSYSGIEVMSRARLLRREVVIVVLTSRASVSTAVAAVRVGAADYLVKPCRTEDVELVIAHALEQRAERLKQQHLLSLVSQAIGILNQSQSTDTTPLPHAPIAESGENFQHGPITLHKEKRQVTLGTEPPRTVDLTEGEWAILLCLLDKPNQVFSYKQLAKLALGYDGMDKWTTESVIRSSVFRLRRKIEPSESDSQFIKTVRGRGYFFSPA